MALKFKTSGSADDALTQLLQLSELSQKRKDRKESRVVADLNNIIKLSEGALTQEQMQNAKNALANLSETDMTDTTRLASQVTGAALDNRQFEMNQYESRIDQASAIFSDPNYLDTADEWRDLETLRKSDLYKKDDGTYMYESTAVMLGDLYSQANTIYEGIESGSAKGFKTDSNIDFFDDEVKTKIKTYKDRLEKAIAADVGDGIITVEEARMIMGGMTKAGMEKEFKERATNTARYIEKQEALLKVYESNDPLNNMQTLFQLKGEDGEPLMDEDSIPNDLVNQLMLGQQVPQETIDDLKRELSKSYGRFERLTGSSYQGVTDTPATDVGELRKAAEGEWEKDEQDIELEKFEELSLQEQKDYIKEKKEIGQKQLKEDVINKERSFYENMSKKDQEMISKYFDESNFQDGKVNEATIIDINKQMRRLARLQKTGARSESNKKRIKALSQLKTSLQQYAGYIRKIKQLTNAGKSIPADLRDSVNQSLTKVTRLFANIDSK